MTNQHRRMAAKISAEALDEVYRAVPSAGAADGDRERAAAVLPVCGQPGLDESSDIPQHRADLRLPLEKCDDLRVQTGQGSQARIVMRIGQTAHVEHQIRVQGNPLLVAERFEQKRSEERRVGKECRSRWS